MAMMFLLSYGMHTQPLRPECGGGGPNNCPAARTAKTQMARPRNADFLNRNRISSC